MLAPKVAPAASRCPMSWPTASLVRSTVDSETRKVLGLMGARVVEAELSLGKAPDWLAEPDEDLLGQLRAVIVLLVTEAADRVVAAAA